ncbi:MAG TPA: ABC transporter [Treponema sp.]|jgi:iron complex transport system ATP-binding protein|nr:ABC transporter [Treponema sp.]HBB41944.1 ABC transporter [Treponema sp.]
MKSISFNDVSFAYPAVEGDLDSDGKPVIPRAVFDHFTGEIPAGFTSLIGPNGSGKSTFMMLASGRLVPQNGKVLLFGQDVASLDGERKNLLASVIYQNMEFESRDKVSQLLSFVYADGALKANAKGIRTDVDLLTEVIDVFELEKVMNHGLTELSKGEIQRVLLAFSLLYGSASVFMDEPLFAMEDRQKKSALEYLGEFAEKTGTTIFISMHELDLTRRYVPNVLLFYPNRDMDYGTPEEVMTDEALEKAYGVPVAMLKKAEDLKIEELSQTSDAILQMQRTVQKD